MSAALQNRIAPPVAQAAKSLSDVAVKKDEAAKDKEGSGSKVDFRDLIMNSNTEISKKRAAQKAGDLSGSKNYEDFLENLSKQTSKQRAPKNTLGKDDFLRLFVTQMQNQDPLNPKDGTEMASQLAQFNGLEQMMNVNKTLERMETAQGTGRSVDYVNYIGKDIELKGGRVKLDAGTISDVSFKLSRDVSQSTLEVRDASGTVVAKKDLGSIPRGEHKMGWDGKALDGSKLTDGLYTFSITAQTAQGDATPVEITSRVNVSGIDMSTGSAQFLTEFGSINYDEISAVGKKGSLGTESLQPARQIQKNDQENKIREAQSTPTNQPQGNHLAANRQPQRASTPKTPQQALPSTPFAPQVPVNNKKSVEKSPLDNNSQAQSQQAQGSPAA